MNNGKSIRTASKNYLGDLGKNFVKFCKILFSIKLKQYLGCLKTID
jgi:hypothetical protein